jgi:hypothetical protein
MIMSKTQIKLTIVYLITLFSSVGCATAQLPNAGDTDARPNYVENSPSYDGTVVSIRDAQERRDIATWERQRALYLYDLHMADLERKFDSLSDPNYLLGEKLIQAALKVAYAESDRLTLDESESTLYDLADASASLVEADNLAPPADRPRLAEIENLLTMAQASAASGHYISPAYETHTYKALRIELDRLIQDVG